MKPEINYSIRITRSGWTRKGPGNTEMRGRIAGTEPDALYHAQGFAYPKFFKMDPLSKWAWLGAELLLHEQANSMLYRDTDPEKTALALFTASGCLATDKKYSETMSGIPSPALFVYTLPNIMLGELCIRHGFKGEQMCMVMPSPESAEALMRGWTEDVLYRMGMEACLCGWADISGQEPDIRMDWITP